MSHRPKSDQELEERRRSLDRLRRLTEREGRQPTEAEIMEVLGAMLNADLERLAQLVQEAEADGRSSALAQTVRAIARRAKLKVSQGVSRFGNQLFIFRLQNGRTVEIEFCPHLIDPGGNASCAVVGLLDENGARQGIAVNESGGEQTMMKAPCLWFTTREEDGKNRRKVREELDTIKEQLDNLASHGEGPCR
jgi:hypothetical protein